MIELQIMLIRVSHRALSFLIAVRVVINWNYEQYHADKRSVQSPTLPSPVRVELRRVHFLQSVQELD